MKSVAIITISHEVAIFYKFILESVYDENLMIKIYSLEKTGIENIGVHDLYLVATTSSDIYSYVISNITDESKIVIAQLTFLKKDIEHLRTLPEMTALFINLSEKMAQESIAHLHRLGINNIRFVPYYPGAKKTDISFALTSGEARYAPDSVTELIDVGNRYLSANTITEIALKLDMRDALYGEAYIGYINNLAEQDYALSTLRDETISMENKFEALVENVNFALIGIDANLNVVIFNPLAEKYTGCSRSMIMDKNILKYIGEFGVIDFEANTTQYYLVELMNEEYTVQVTPIIMSNGRAGNYIMLQKFQELELSQANVRKQLVSKKRHVKYSFDDIICNCETMTRAKNIAKKMANTDLSVLLYGESGTGKELFAHSIHNASKRRGMPFVAINCSAIPDNLLESELFGYVDGAFTGAVKGGKLGLFEQAHKGTIFLDEIETMSPNLQIKLLRVLEEKEIMRVGDIKTISIDVRIICATNEDIRKMVKEGVFRKDLYYRLNTLPIEIPPLRERKGDILLLADVIKTQIGAKYELSDDCKDVFLNYQWDGNVRELKNILEYLKFMELEKVTANDLPEEMLEEYHGYFDDLRLSVSEIDVLREIYNNGGGIGRNAILGKLNSKGEFLTENEVRKILKKLSKTGFVNIGKGRAGTKINSARANEIKRLTGE